MSNHACFVPPKTQEQAVEWVKSVTSAIGLGFHPDTGAADYVNRLTNEPLFSSVEAQAFDEALAQAINLLGDSIYEYGAAIQQKFLRGTVAMDKKTAEQLEALVGGEAWERNGEWVVSAHEEDGTVVLYTGQGIFQYEDDSALDADKPMASVNASIPSAEDLWVLIDEQGDIIYQNNLLKRGWRYQEDAQRQARVLHTNAGVKFRVERAAGTF